MRNSDDAQQDIKTYDCAVCSEISAGACTPSCPLPTWLNAADAVYKHHNTNLYKTVLHTEGNMQADVVMDLKHHAAGRAVFKRFMLCSLHESACQSYNVTILYCAKAMSACANHKSARVADEAFA